MITSLFLTFVGCNDEISTSSFAATSSYSLTSNYLDSHGHHDGDTSSHNTCELFCTHNFIVTTNEILPLVAFDGSNPNWSYLFSYKNQSLDTLKRPPLAV
jgi:hypothetical protein